MGTRTGARIERGTNVTVVRKGWGWVEVGHGGLYLINGNTEAGAFISRHITAEVLFFFFSRWVVTVKRKGHQEPT